MQINLDEQVIQDSMNKAAATAIANAAGARDVQRAIEDGVVKTIVNSAFTDAVNAAISSLDMQELSLALSKELSRAVTAAAVRMIRESTIELILGLRKIPSYDAARLEKARAEILAKVFSE